MGSMKKLIEDRLRARHLGEGGEDRAVGADGPARARVGKVNAMEVVAAAAPLRHPARAAVAGGEDRAIVADGPARARVGKVNAAEAIAGAARLCLPCRTRQAIA